MDSPIHRPHDCGQRSEQFRLLAAQEWASFKERDYFHKEILSPADYVKVRSVPLGQTVNLPQRSATEVNANEVQDLESRHVLADANSETSCLPTLVPGFRCSAS